jgi:hypothetical protein
MGVTVRNNASLKGTAKQQVQEEKVRQRKEGERGATHGPLLAP